MVSSIDIGRVFRCYSQSAEAAEPPQKKAKQSPQVHVCLAERPPWFLTQLEDYGVAFDPDNSRYESTVGSTAAKQYLIIGIIKVAHRGFQLHDGVLTSWQAEAELLRAIYQDPRDSIVLEFTHAAVLRTPLSVMSQLIDPEHGTAAIGGASARKRSQ